MIYCQKFYNYLEICDIYQVLARLEEEARKVCLHCNSKKTKMQVFNLKAPVAVKAKDGKELKTATNFKYLVAWMESTEKDVALRETLAWCVPHKLKKVWNSKTSKNLK